MQKKNKKLDKTLSAKMQTFEKQISIAEIVSMPFLMLYQSANKSVFQINRIYVSTNIYIYLSIYLGVVCSISVVFSFFTMFCLFVCLTVCMFFVVFVHFFPFFFFRCIYVYFTEFYIETITANTPNKSAVSASTATIFA